MSNNSKAASVIESAKSLGFTEYEAKLYFTLASRSSAITVEELSRASKVPYTKAYSVLSALTQRGLAEVMRGKPATYRIVEPKTALASLKETMTSEISKAYEEVVSTLLRIRSETSYDNGHGASWNISGKRNVLNKLTEETEHAMHSVDIVLPDLAGLGNEIITRILPRFSSHIGVRLLVSPKDKKTIKNISSKAEIRYSGYVKSRYALFDNKHSLMIAVETPDYWTGVFETCGNCTRQAVEHFNLAWNASKAN